MVKDVETYWAAEVGEQVDILPDGWLNCPTDYSLYIAGQYMVTLGSMAGVEAWLERYSVLRAQLTLDREPYDTPYWANEFRREND